MSEAKYLVMELPRVWKLDDPDEFLELAGKIHEALMIRLDIPEDRRPDVKITLEITYG